MRILNLYAGIGGNRKLWPDEHEITAVENVPHIADVYRQLFPNDTVIEADAHQYLLDHYKEFDFIWSSPPCPTHSRARFWGMNRGYKPVYPDMNLYSEILLLKHYFKGNWVVENVISFYEPLIRPVKLHRHYYWANFPILPLDSEPQSFSAIKNSQALLEQHLGFSIKSYPFKGDKRVLLRNAVEPEVGLHIFNCQDNLKQLELTAPTGNKKG